MVKFEVSLTSNMDRDRPKQALARSFITFGNKRVFAPR